jgi:hypothetical protein
MAKFILPPVHEGKTMVLLDKYPFKDGVFTTNNASAMLMKTILCRDYECTLELDVVAEEGSNESTNAEGSLAVQSTKLGQAVINEDAALKAAEAEALKSIADEAEALKKVADEAKPATAKTK